MAANQNARIPARKKSRRFVLPEALVAALLPTNQDSRKHMAVPAVFPGSAIKAPEFSGPLTTNQTSLLRRDHGKRGRLRHDRNAGHIRFELHHLSRVRGFQTQLPCHEIDSSRIAQSRLFQLEGAVCLDQTFTLDLLRFNLIAILQSTEVLPGVKHHDNEERVHRRGEDTDLPPAPWIRHSPQTRLIDRLLGIKFGRYPGGRT